MVTTPVELSDRLEDTHFIVFPMTHRRPPWLYDREVWDGEGWKVTFFREGRQLTVPYWMGAALGGRTPVKVEVMECLLTDASTFENADGDFDAWRYDYGYGFDDARAQRIFNATRVLVRKLKRFLGDDYAAFLWESDG